MKLKICNYYNSDQQMHSVLLKLQYYTTLRRGWCFSHCCNFNKVECICWFEL